MWKKTLGVLAAITMLVTVGGVASPAQGAEALAYAKHAYDAAGVAPGNIAFQTEYGDVVYLGTNQGARVTYRWDDTRRVRLVRAGSGWCVWEEFKFDSNMDGTYVKQGDYNYGKGVASQWFQVKEYSASALSYPGHVWSSYHIYPC